MRRLPIVIAAAAAFLLLAASCSRDGKVIPKKTMEDIYYDMFLSDQWLTGNYQARKVADTTLFYEPVFRKYGYTFKDFDKSVNHYLKDPEKYAKMLKNVADRFDKKAAELTKVKEAIDAYREPGGYESSFFTADSLVWADSLVLWLRPPVDTAAVDSLALNLASLDSLALDSLLRSLVPMDSLRVLTDSLARDTLMKLYPLTDSLTLDSLSRKLTEF